MHFCLRAGRFTTPWRTTTWTWCECCCPTEPTPPWPRTPAVAFSRWLTVTAWSASSLVRPPTGFSFSTLVTTSSPHLNLPAAAQRAALYIIRVFNENSKGLKRMKRLHNFWLQQQRLEVNRIIIWARGSLVDYVNQNLHSFVIVQDNKLPCTAHSVNDYYLTLHI